MTCGMHRTEYGSCTRRSRMRWDNLAAFEKLKHHGRDSYLPCMATRLLDPRIEGLIEPWMASSESAPEINADAKTFSAPNRPASASAVILRAIEQGQASLALAQRAASPTRPTLRTRLRFHHWP